MPKPKVFVTRIIREKGLDLVKEFCEAEIWPEELPPDRATLLEKVRGVEGILCLLTDRIDAEVLDAAGLQLKVVSNHAVGFDNIAIGEATARGIPVGNTPGILTDATADFAFALLLAAARRLTEAERYLRAGRWVTWGPSTLLGMDLAGKTLGLIGFGRIGQAVAKRAIGFDLRVLYYDPSALPAWNATPVETLDELLRQSDFVSIHTPLTERTRRMVNAEFLAKMKPTAVLVNTARGGVLDQEALYEALKAQRIFAAALDVTDPEPLPLDSPLLTLENCLITPHIASASAYTRDMMAYLAAQNLLAGLKGERLPYCVNPEVYNRA
ncbi:MAG: D-glycerate dehydrogenase [Anaerolineales bacterium]|nr:D-glycerate dehydrogenase [Anaerolineales bacterium]MDW8277002.1 D-glycerate dehydrogenase [Anaerolineales bacterium]